VTPAPAGTSHVRHRPRHCLRLLALGVPGLRQPVRRHLQHTDAALNQPATASSTESATFPASNGSTATPAPAGPAPSPTPVAGSRPGFSQTICQVTLNWEAAYATAFRSRPRRTARRGPRSTHHHGTGGVQTLNVSGHRPVCPHVRHHPRTAYGYSLWEFGVYTTTGGAPVTRHGHQPRQPDRHGRHRGEQADQRHRLGLRPDADLLRHGLPRACPSARPG